MSRQDLDRCIRHRLEVAGARRNPFTASGLAALHRKSRGIPRVANLIADRALLGAYALDQDSIGAAIVTQAAREVAGRRDHQGRWPLAAAAGLLAVAGGADLWWSLPLGSAPPDLTGPPAVEREVPTVREAPPQETAATAATPGGTDNTATPAETQIPNQEPSGKVPATDEQEAGPAAGVALTWTGDDSESPRQQAFQAVVDRWFVPLRIDSADGICDRAATVGLACLEFDGSWDALLALDLPAVLRTETGPVAMLAVQDNQVKVADEKPARWVAQGQLQRRWQGAATVLWQLPPGYSQPLTRGSRGEAVRWLRRQLDRAGQRASGRADEFDAALESAVRRFQDVAGIEEDGIAGPLTWIHLQRVTGTGIPSITATGEN